MGFFPFCEILILEQVPSFFLRETPISGGWPISWLFKLKYGQIYEIALKTREGVNSTSFEWHFWNLQKKVAKKPTPIRKIWLAMWTLLTYICVISASSVRHWCVITPYYSRKWASFDVIICICIEVTYGWNRDKLPRIWPAFYPLNTLSQKAFDSLL